MQNDINTARFDCSFASANTSGGFVSYFPMIFDERKLDTLIVLKGGPGSGKSTLMRAFASRAQKKGYKVRAILCSSDPSSIDGVIIPELSIAMLDGTAPHIYDPGITGAVGRIFDLARFLDRKALNASKDKIIALGDEKSLHYRRALEYLSCAGKLSRLEGEALDFDYGKASAFLRALIAGESQTTEATVNFLPYSSYGMNGLCSLDPFPNADKTVYVKQFHGSERILLDTAAKEALRAGISVTVSPDPLVPETPAALIFPALNIRIVSECAENSAVRASSFASLPKDKDERAAAAKLASSRWQLISGANDEFALMKKAHFALEEIYSSAMDFVTKESAQEALIDELLN